LVYTGKDSKEDLEKVGKPIKEFFLSNLDENGK